MSRSKSIGTGFETDVVRWVQACLGHVLLPAPLGVRRLALAGVEDEGDILLGLRDGRSVVLECKAGRAAERASRNQILAWLAETERERAHAGASLGYLVRKVAAVGATRAELWALHGFSHLPGCTPVAIEATLGDLPCLLGVA